MDRRTFVKLLLGTALAEAIDVERLLWVPKPIVTVPEMVGVDFGSRHDLHVDALLTKLSLAYRQNTYFVDHLMMTSDRLVLR